MSQTRPPWQELDDVDDAEPLARLVRPQSINRNAPPGARVQTSALQRKEIPLSSSSYGASVFVSSQLTGGIDDVLATKSPGATYEVSEVATRRYKAVFDGVKYTPMDCPTKTIAHAHASLIADRPKKEFIALRNTAIKIIEEGLSFE